MTSNLTEVLDLIRDIPSKPADSMGIDVTIDQVMDWMGDSSRRVDFGQLLMEIANGDYEPSLLRKDIETYCD